MLSSLLRSRWWINEPLFQPKTWTLVVALPRLNSSSWHLGQWDDRWIDNESETKQHFKISTFLGPDSLIGIKLKNGQDQYQILQRLTGGLMKILHEVEYKNFTAKDVEKILKDTYTAGRLEKQKVWNSFISILVTFLFWWRMTPVGAISGIFMLKDEGLVTKAANAVINTLVLSPTYFVIHTNLINLLFELKRYQF